jgi:energy-coupling factor transporter ATP-binding protein EcfA2
VKWKSDIVVQPHDVVLFVGKKGSGKSTRLKAALAMAMKAGQRCVVFDPLDEYSEDGRKRASVVLGPLTRRMTTEEFAEDVDVLLEDGLALAVVPVGSDPEEWAADFAALLEEVEDVGDLILGADELAVWGQHCPKAIDRAACLSRHWGDEGVGLLLGSQRATGIPFTTRTQASQINSGIQDMPADVAALEERCGRAFAEEVSRLKRGEFRHWRDDDGALAPKEKKP